MLFNRFVTFSKVLPRFLTAFRACRRCRRSKSGRRREKKNRLQTTGINSVVGLQRSVTIILRTVMA